MAHTVRFRQRSQTEFSKRFSSLCNSKSAWEVWTDFVTLSALSIANAVDQEGQTHDEREQEYLQTIQRYSPQEQKVFPELFAIMAAALEDEPNQDFLGEMFMLLKLGSHWHGQFFTPYCIGSMMARMTMAQTGRYIAEKGWVGINDPCCGAGALLIAARNEMVRQGFGSTHALFVAQDLERTAALMCYVQLSLLGCAGYIVVANSLSDPVVNPSGSPLLIAPQPGQEIWIMPATCLDTWCARMRWEQLRLAMAALGVMSRQEKPLKVQTREKVPEPQPLHENADGQLTLF